MDGNIADFVGDGKYCGDGGEILQRFWEMWKWTEIKNCPGRYVTKSNVDAQVVSPQELCNSLAVRHLPLIHCSADRLDQIAVVHFDSGGGIITYIKPNGTFVHTLNTESGYVRKMRALGFYIIEEV
jgi:hypothetical protein